MIDTIYIGVPYACKISSIGEEGLDATMMDARLFHAASNTYFSADLTQDDESIIAEWDTSDMQPGIYALEVFATDGPLDPSITAVLYRDDKYAKAIAVSITEGAKPGNLLHGGDDILPGDSTIRDDDMAGEMGGYQSGQGKL